MKFFKLWLPVILWAAFIFFLSNIPYLKTDLAYDFPLRKAAHLAEYFVLAGLLRRAFLGSFQRDGFSLFIYPAGLSLAYALTDELHQSWVAGRHASFLDVLVDALGILGFYAALRVRFGEAKK